MDWDIGTTIGTKKGTAKAISIEGNEIVFQVIKDPDDNPIDNGETFRFPYIKQEKTSTDVVRKPRRTHLKSTTHIPQVSTEPSEADLQAQLEKAQAKLNAARAAKEAAKEAKGV